MYGRQTALAHHPLPRQRKIVVSNLREVALLPQAAIHESNLIHSEPGNVIGFEIRNDRVGMRLRIAHHIRHRRLLPARINLRVTFLTRLRAHILRRPGCGGHLQSLLFV